MIIHYTYNTCFEKICICRLEKCLCKKVSILYRPFLTTVLCVRGILTDCGVCLNGGAVGTAVNIAYSSFKAKSHIPKALQINIPVRQGRHFALESRISDTSSISCPIPFRTSWSFLLPLFAGLFTCSFNLPRSESEHNNQYTHR